MTVTDADYGSGFVLERLGSPLHYWLRGAAAAPLVTFIHGAGLDHRTWGPQVDEFARDHRVLTLDIRGHGSSRPFGEYSFSNIVEDCLAVLDAAGAPTTILVGLSLGGNVAQEIAFRTPQRVSALICVGCTCNTMLTAWERRTVPIYAAMFAPLLALVPRQMLLNAIAKQTSLMPEAQLYIHEAESRLTKPETAMVMKTLFTALHHEPDYKVALPELLMRGSQDTLGNIRKVMPLWHRRDPNSEFVIVPGAGHAANLDNPEFVNKVVLDWLSRIRNEVRGV